MNSKKSVIALGKFDGIHLGHQKLISTAVERASAQRAEALVYAIGSPTKGAIITRTEKDNLLRSMGIDKIIYRPLDGEIKNMLPKEFVSAILADELGASCVVVGENFRFGRGRCADCSELKELCEEQGIDTVIIKTVETTHCGRTESVSSTLIRDYLALGRVSCAAKHLGRLFSVSGVVESGKHLGRKMGFPTINILPGSEKLVPMSGVYATYAHFSGRTYHAITNVGTNPTVEDSNVIKVETHLFDEDIDCYGREVTVSFADFIRGEMCFDSVTALAQQIEDDKQKARQILDERVGQDGF